MIRLWSKIVKKINFLLHFALKMGLIKCPENCQNTTMCVA